MTAEANSGKDEPQNENTQPARLSAVTWITTGLNEWIVLLGTPDSAVFKPNPSFEWSRLLRLIVVVLGFTGAILGLSLVVYKGNISDIVFQKAPAAVLLAGALLAVGYTFTAQLFGVRITVRDAFFTILLLGLPWLSLTAALYVWAGASRMPTMGLVLLLWVLLAPLILFRNVCSALAMIHTECNKWRIRLSVIIPVFVLLVALLAVWLFAEVPNAP